MKLEQTYSSRFYLIIFPFLTLITIGAIYLETPLLFVFIGFIVLIFGLVISVRYLLLSSRMVIFEEPVIILRNIKTQFSAHYDDLLYISFYYLIDKNRGPWRIVMVKRKYTTFEVIIPHPSSEKQQKLHRILSRQLTLRFKTEKYMTWYAPNIGDNEYREYLQTLQMGNKNEISNGELRDVMMDQLRELEDSIL